MSDMLEEYEDRPVPASARRSLASVSAVWLGFPMILTCAPLYVALGVVAAVLAASGPGAGAVTSFAGGAGADALGFGAAVTLVVASFIDSGTMTGDFTRWSRDGRSGFLAALAAFPVGNTVALVIGGVIVALGAATDPGTDGGNFLSILIGQGGILVPLAVLFVFVNLGSVCAHCLYNGAVGWSQLTGRRMRLLTVALGAVGIVLAVAGIWSYFESWLTLLGVVVPPIGTVLILDLLVLPRRGLPPVERAWRAEAFVGWGVGAAAALLAHLFAAWLSDALVGIVVTAAVFVLLRTRTRAPAGAVGVAQEVDA